MRVQEKKRNWNIKRKNWIEKKEKKEEEEEPYFIKLDYRNI